MKEAVLEITLQTVLDILKTFNQGFTGLTSVIENGLPKDVVVVNSRVMSWNEYVEPYYSTIQLKLNSDSFEDIPNGQLIPILPPVIFKTIELSEPIKIIRELLDVINTFTHVTEKGRYNSFMPGVNLNNQIKDQISSAVEYLKEIEGGE